MAVAIGILSMVCFIGIVAFIFQRLSKKLITKIDKSIERDNLKRQEQIQSLFVELKRELKKKPKKVKPQNDVNPYFSGHERFKADRLKAAELRASFKRGTKQLENQYVEYLEWCKETGETPNQNPPTDRVKNYHFN